MGACGGGDNSNGDTNNNNADNGNVEVSAADEVYKKSCATCHGGNLDAMKDADLNTVGSRYSAEEIEDIIENGTDTGMPAQKQVSAEDRELLAGWLADKK